MPIQESPIITRAKEMSAADRNRGVKDAIIEAIKSLHEKYKDFEEEIKMSLGKLKNNHYDDEISKLTRKLAYNIRIALTHAEVVKNADKEFRTKGIDHIDIVMKKLDENKILPKEILDELSTFDWTLLARQNADEHRRKLEQQEQKRIVEANPTLKKTKELTEYAYGLDSASPLQLRSQVPDFLSKLASVVGDNFEDKVNFLESVIMEQVKMLQAKVGGGETDEEREARIANFRRAFRIINNLLMPSLREEFIKNPDFRDIRDRFEAGLKEINQGIFAPDSRPGNYFHEADLANITKGLGEIRSLVRELRAKREAAAERDRSAGPGAGVKPE